jgi:hypothetical protein
MNVKIEKLVIYNSKDFGLLFSPLIFVVRVYNVKAMFGFFSLGTKV